MLPFDVRHLHDLGVNDTQQLRSGLGEMTGHVSEQRQTRRQLLILAPFKPQYDAPVEWRRLRLTVTICLPSSTTAPGGISDTLGTGVLKTRIHPACRMSLLFTFCNST